MSRSVHTRPRRIRAADRLRHPRRSRSESAKSRSQLELQLSEELELPAARASDPWELPPIVEARPRPGFHHPAGKAEIAHILRFFGEEYVYGLRSIELRQCDPHAPGLQLGRLVVPGQVILYEQRPSPWTLPGELDEAELEHLTRAGAEIETLESVVIVSWPGETLEHFMLLDVLMHEIGHHLLQHHKGKRLARVARTRDHESYADAVARRCRELWEARDDASE